MKFKVLLEELLTELSGDEIYQKFYSKIPYEDYTKIVSIDPQTKIVDGKIVKIGKYTKLFLVMYLKGALKMEDAVKASEYIGYVYNHNIPLEINQIQSIGDLYNLIKDYIVKDTKDLGEILKVLDPSEFKVLHNGKDWYIFQPLTEKSSCYLGVNTQWCTTWGPHSINRDVKDRSSQFENYIKRGPLYIIINKSDNNIKYQFHFESGQYMDPSDRQINTGKLLDGNKELLQYFFPSFYQEVNGDQLNLEIKRMDILSIVYMSKLVERMAEGTQNPIIVSILNDDVDRLIVLIEDADIENITIYDQTIEFEVRSYKQDVDLVDNTLNYYNYDDGRGSETVYENLTGNGLDEYMIEEFEKYFKQYYDVKKDWIRETMGVTDFQIFQKHHFHDFIGNEKNLSIFYDVTAEKTGPSYDDLVRQKIIQIQKIIKFNRNDFEVSKPLFIKTLLKKEVSKIGTDDLWKFWDFMDEFCSENDLETEYEPIYDYATTYPDYTDDDRMSRQIDEYFDDIVHRYYSSEYDDIEGHPCIELRKKLNNIIEKLFKLDNFGVYVYEDENIMVQIKSLAIDCDEGTVPVIYQNKQTGKTYGQHRDPDGVKIDNLASLVTNYKLFEEIRRFNKNIK